MIINIMPLWLQKMKHINKDEDNVVHFVHKSI